MIKRTLADFRNRLTGHRVIVCGCGESLNEFEGKPQLFTIGVNDVGRRFAPDYLVVVNKREEFAPERWRYVVESDAIYLFTCYDLPLPYLFKPTTINFQLGERSGTDLASDDSLPYTSNSPYVALCLAAFMGASEIGLIGVDFSENHFFAQDGPHTLNRQLKRIDGEYRALGDALKEKGVQVVNLSARSKLTAFEKMTIEEFSK